MQSLVRVVALLAVVIAMVVLATSRAPAQAVVTICLQLVPGPSCAPVTSTNPLPVNASVSASISGFTATSTGTPISVTTGSSTGTLPAGAVVVVTNVGATNAAYCALGAAATTSSQYIAPAGGWFAFTVGVSTQLTCVTSASTTTVNMTGGTGLPTGTGGGGGSGSSSAITTWGGGTLGAMANYGTSPGAVLVPGVNAFVTNTVTSNATLSAETTKVIGTVRNLGNAGAIFDAATGAAVPANALYAGMNQGGNLTGLTGTAGNLNVQCSNCTGSGVSAADEAVFTAGTSLFAGTGGFFQTTPTNNALTNGQQGMWQMTANRAGFINLRNAAGTEVGTAAAPVRTDPVGTTTQPMALVAVNAATALAGNGPTGTGSSRVTIANDNTIPSGWPTAANQATEIASLASIDTKVGSPVPLGGGSGGMTPLKLTALTNTAIAIKASAGQLYKLYCYNPNATIVYIQVYNVAAAGVTVGTTAALQSYGIPATTSSGFAHSLVGDQYGTAISAAATTGAGNATAPGTAVDCNVSYN